MNGRRWAGPAIFLGALALRLGWIAYAGTQHGSTLQLPDEQLHWQLARNLATRGELVTDDGRYAARMPLYPLFLAAFAAGGDAGIWFARGAQALLGAFTAWLVYAFAARALSRRAGLLAGGLVAIDLYAIFFSNLLLTETLFTFVGVGLVACAWEAFARPPGLRGSVAGVGLFGAAAVLVRPAALGLVVLLWLVERITDRETLRAFVRISVWASLLAAALLPWGLRNKAVLGDFAWLSTNGGVTLYDGQGPQATGASDQRFLGCMPELAGMDEVGRDRRLQELAREEMRKDPGRVLRLAGMKFLRTWSLTPNAEEYRSGWRDLASAVFSGAVLLAGAVGVWRLRRRPMLFVLLLLPIAYVTLVHCVYIGSLRYRVPVMPFVELLAAAGIIGCATANSASDRRESVAP